MVNELSAAKEQKIKTKLLTHYGYKNDDRELVKTQSLSSYGAVGAVLYALCGSPPKGYALYIPEINRVNYYDSSGERFSKEDFV